LPWSALPAVGTPATLATYHCQATGRPDSSSSSSGWVRERSPVDFPTVTSTSDRGIRGTSDDDTTGCGHFLLPGSATDDHTYIAQLVSPLTTGALVFETPARTTLPSPPASTPLPTFTTPRTEGLGQEDHYLRAIMEQISAALASDTVPPVPEATTAPEATPTPTSGTGTTTAPPAPPPPAPGSTSLTWSLLSEEDDDDDASGFSVRPSQVVSTSPSDPSSPPQA
jgi:hypothetical protein